MWCIDAATAGGARSALSMASRGSVRRRAGAAVSEGAVVSVVASASKWVPGIATGASRREWLAPAIFLAVLLFFRRSWWPHGAVLAHSDGVGGWHDAAQLAAPTEVRGVLVYRWGAPFTLPMRARSGSRSDG